MVPQKEHGKKTKILMCTIPSAVNDKTTDEKETRINKQTNRTKKKEKKIKKGREWAEG